MLSEYHVRARENHNKIGEAVLKLEALGRKLYYIQCTTWRDKKQVCFLSNNGVGFSIGLYVKRHIKGKEMRTNIDGLRA